MLTRPGALPPVLTPAYMHGLVTGSNDAERYQYAVTKSYSFDEIKRRRLLAYFMVLIFFFYFWTESNADFTKCSKTIKLLRKLLNCQ